MPQMRFKDEKGGIVTSIFRRWKSKGKMYSLRCNQCGSGFLSSLNLDAPICGKCLQKAKSLDSTVDNEKVCSKCRKSGVIYGKEMCHSCYFGFEKKEEALR
jgi:RecJ-like exonuclease